MDAQKALASDDDALMAQVAARSGEAFRMLATRHAAVPHCVAYRMLGNATEAEDIAQESMLRLWDGAARWQGKGPGVAAWLRRVATNLCLDRLRRQKFQSDEAVPERADDAPLADALIDEARRTAKTRDAIASLTDRQRAAIILTYYEECSNMGAANALQMNVKAFESLLLRARGALRRHLESDGVLHSATGGGA
jgi:RNA polymerase sigma factor (sigma-70 family)